MDKNILVIGDLHLKLSNLEIAEQFFTYLYDLVDEHEVKTIVFLGDVYDGKALIHADVQTFLLEKISMLSSCIKIYIIVGNHDFASQNLGNHSLKPLELFENVTVVDRLLVEDKCSFIAYGKSADIEAILQLPEVKGKIVFGHFAVNGFQYGPKVVDDGVDPKLFTGPAILGHIHTPCDKGNIHYLGSPWSHSFGEANQHKRLLLITESGSKMIGMEDRLPRHVSLDWSDKGSFPITSEHDFVRLTNVPLSSRDAARESLKRYANVSLDFLPELNDVVRIDATKSFEGMLKEYIEKNLMASKFVDLDKKKLYTLGSKYLEAK